jgi:hypothetical protein
MRLATIGSHEKAFPIDFPPPHYTAFIIEEHSSVVGLSTQLEAERFTILPL